MDRAAQVMDTDQNIAAAKDDAAVYAAFYWNLKGRGISEDHSLELTREYMQGRMGTFRAVIMGDISED